VNAHSHGNLQIYIYIVCKHSISTQHFPKFWASRTSLLCTEILLYWYLFYSAYEFSTYLQTFEINSPLHQISPRLIKTTQAR